MSEFKRWMLSRNSEQEQEKRIADLAHEIILLQYKVIEKDKRIAELEAQIANYTKFLIDALQDVINYAPACTSSIEYAEKRLKELTEVEK